MPQRNIQSDIQNPERIRNDQIKLGVLDCVSPTQKYGESRKRLERDSNWFPHQPKFYEVWYVPTDVVYDCW